MNRGTILVETFNHVKDTLLKETENKLKNNDDLSNISSNLTVKKLDNIEWSIIKEQLAIEMSGYLLNMKKFVYKADEENSECYQNLFVKFSMGEAVIEQPKTKTHQR